MPVKQILANPVEARYIRINPLSWHGAISMRVDVLGCGGVEEASTIAYEVTAAEPACADTMGLDSGALPISSITVSSFRPGHGPDKIRLSGETAWQPLVSSHLEFISIDLMEPRNLTGIETKGMPPSQGVGSLVSTAWVESYRLLYSPNGVVWNPIMDSAGTEKVRTD